MATLRTTVAMLTVLCALSLPAVDPAEAQVRLGSGSGRRGSPAPLDAPTERRGQPAAEPADVQAEQPEEVGDLLGQISQWSQRLYLDLVQVLTVPGAWTVILSPIWVSLVVLVLIRRRKARNAPRKVGTDGPQSDSRSEVAVDEANVAPQLVPDQELLLGAGGVGPSLYETFVALGCDAVAIEAFSERVGLTLDAAGWDAAVTDQTLADAGSLRAMWVKDVATRRVAQWLAAHPLVVREGLRVDTPAVLEPEELANLTLTQPSGLATALEAPLEGLLERARRGVATVYRQSSPYSTQQAAREVDIATLQDPGLQELTQSLSRPLALALLLRGSVALEHATSARIFDAEFAGELRAALQEHLGLVGTQPPGEGCAVFAAGLLGRRATEGIGTLLAAVGGAAYSPAAVTLRVSKHANAMRPADQRDALADLGRLIVKLLEEPARGNGLVFYENVRRVFGQTWLEEESARVSELLKTVSRLRARQPLWVRGGAARSQSPDLALLKLHQALLRHARLQVQAAEKRFDVILQRLAYVGQRGDNRNVAYRRLGYAVAGFGTELLKSTSTDLLSAGREAVVALHGRSG